MFTLQTTAQVLAIIIIAGYLTWKELRESVKRKRMKLLPNPDRCGAHAEAINAINDTINNEIRPDLQSIKDRLGIV